MKPDVRGGAFVNTMEKSGLSSWGRPTWGQLEANLGPIWINLRPTGANMQQLGINWGPTRANMVARGQLGINMYLAKPEKLVFRLHGNTIFTKLCVSPWTRFGTPWGCLGRSWGAPWRIFMEDLGKTLEELPGRRKNLGGSSWKSTSNRETP